MSRQQAVAVHLEMKEAAVPAPPAAAAAAAGEGDEVALSSAVLPAPAGAAASAVPAFARAARVIFELEGLRSDVECTFAKSLLVSIGCSAC